MSHIKFDNPVNSFFTFLKELQYYLIVQNKCSKSDCFYLTFKKHRNEVSVCESDIFLPPKTVTDIGLTLNWFGKSLFYFVGQMFFDEKTWNHCKSNIFRSLI